MRFKGLLLAAVLVLPGCFVWRADSRPPAQVVRERGAGDLAFTMADRRWIVLRDSRLQNDTIYGTRVRANVRTERSLALPADRVRTVERRRFSFIRTVLLGAALYFGGPLLYELAFVEEE